MITKHKNISMVRGDTLSFGVHFPGLGGQDLDEIFFSCSSNYMSTDYVFIKTLDDGIKKSEDPDSPDTYIIRTVPDDTESAIPGMYYYDIEAHINGDVFTVMSGNLEIEADVTYKPEDFFAEETYVPDIDPNDFLEALDSVNNDFSISNSEYIVLANKLAIAYSTGVKSFKGQFVTSGTNLYRAKTNATTITTPVSNTTYWELIARNINVTPTEVSGVDYNVKDLFSNMIEYCNRAVDKTVANNKTTLSNVQAYVKNEAATRYSDDKDQNTIIANHIRATRKKHSFQIQNIPANGFLARTFHINAEGATSASAVSTKKMTGYIPACIAGFQFAEAGNAQHAIPLQVYISYATDKGTGKLTVTLRNPSNQAITVVGNVWVLWTKSGDKATLSVAKA